MPLVRTRRRLLTDIAFVSAASLGGVGLSSLSGSGQSRASEPPPEITTVRLAKTPITCVAPQYVAAELLRIEGFTDIQRAIRKSSTTPRSPMSMRIIPSCRAGSSVRFCRLIFIRRSRSPSATSFR